MKPPCEIVTRKVLPAMRALAVKELADAGYRQAKIASLIGISQPAVNYYLKLIEKGELDQKHPLTKEPEIKRAAKEIVKSIRAATNINESIAITCALCRSMRVSGGICAIHRSEVASLPKEQTCGLCLEERVSIERISKRVEVITELAQAAGVLESEAIEDLIPEIGMNFAFALENPRSQADVASFPGRIISIKGRAKAAGIPEFGVSPTLSTILIKLSQLGSKQRCLIYIKNSEKVRAAIKKLRLGHAETKNADKNWSAAIEAIDRKKDAGKVEAILDAGGVGLEPLAYILARNPGEAVEKVRRIVKFSR